MENFWMFIKPKLFTRKISLLICAYRKPQASQILESAKISRQISSSRTSDKSAAIHRRTKESPSLLLRQEKRYLDTCCSTRFYSTARDGENASVAPRSGPLSGVRILDLTRILAGPFCTMILGDLGAEVIKVERPGTGDETRLWGPPFIGSESCYFLCVNRNKKSIAVDLKSKQGKEIILELAKKCDVLVENYVPGKLSKLGLGYEELSKLAPHLIYCSITGYGSTGPYKNRAGLDIIAASVGGLLNVTGPQNGEPCKVGVAMTDLATALYAHGAILVALLERQKTGRGQKIDCNLLSTQVSLLANLASNYLNAGLEARRWGTAHESIVPYQSFKTKEGTYITVGAVTDAQFSTLCKVLSLPSLSQDPLYLTNEDRVKNRDSLLRILNSRFLEKSTNDWLKLLDGSGLPYGPINDMEGVFTDPQVEHSEMVVDMQHSKVGKIRVTGPAVKFSFSSNKAWSPPPFLGEHTDHVLRDVLKMSVQEIQLLKDCGAVA